MTVENLIKKIDVRAQYKALGLGELPLTDSELRAQLSNLLNTAIAELVQNINIDGAVFNVKVTNGAVAVSLSVDGSNVDDIEALEAAVLEYLENEVAYMWWLDNEPRYADGSARELLKDIVERRILCFVAETIPFKREMKPKEVPVTKVEYDYE